MKMPTDQGAALIEHAQHNNTCLQCASDASVINGQG